MIRLLSGEPLLLLSSDMRGSRVGHPKNESVPAELPAAFANEARVIHAVYQHEWREPTHRVYSKHRAANLDIAMLGMPGPELHNELIRRGHSIPVIFIAGRRQALPMSFEKG